MIDKKLLLAFIKGMITFVPGVSVYLAKKKAKTKHSAFKPEFCYNFWLSLLVFLEENKVDAPLARIGELGNGGSYGIGLCALLTSADAYYSFNIEDNFDLSENLLLLDKIVFFLREQMPFSDNDGKINFRVKSYSFPVHLIKPKYLDDKFIETLKNELKHIDNPDNVYLKTGNKNGDSDLNLIFSRAVMEHVKNPAEIYAFMSEKLCSKGGAFHDIEFHSHDVTKTCDGHYKINKICWRIIFGNRKYFLNRWPLKKHLIEMKINNFAVLVIIG